ncbi:AIPR family protein [Methanococcoides sp. FTZ1]|uniref:AIPR family protein n=1 Tax=Methanococcoides sp. FTZ1 TaxID=3439061 RepID=UPI003F8774F2
MSYVLDLELSEDALLTRFNFALVEKIGLFREIWKIAARKNSSISINYVYSSKANANKVNTVFESKMDQIIELTKKSIPNATVAFDLYSSEELLELYRKPHHSELPLLFKENPIAISNIDPHNNSEFGYMGVVYLKDYYDFIVDEETNEIREYLFENNIRDYQGDKADVNEKIAHSIQYENNRDFWWLNNGVTMIVSNCNSNAPKQLFLEDIQIVNGLQTSYALSKHFDPTNPEDNRSLLVKIIVTQNKETMDNIIFATNSQNPVSPTLQRATDEIQRHLEVIFANRGYYYDRRKNYYKNHGKPANKIFSIQHTAQSIEAILNYNPSRARSRPTTLIKEDPAYNRIFNPENIEAFINCCLLHQKVNSFIKNELEMPQKGIAKNFALHISRVAAAALTQEKDYDANKIRDIDMENIGFDEIRNSYYFINRAIGDYTTQNPTANIINVAKSGAFVDMIESKLDEFINA